MVGYSLCESRTIPILRESFDPGEQGFQKVQNKSCQVTLRRLRVENTMNYELIGMREPSYYANTLLGCMDSHGPKAKQLSEVPPCVETAFDLPGGALFVVTKLGLDLSGTPTPGVTYPNKYQDIALKWDIEDAPGVDGSITPFLSIPSWPGCLIGDFGLVLHENRICPFLVGQEGKDSFYASPFVFKHVEKSRIVKGVINTAPMKSQSRVVIFRGSSEGKAMPTSAIYEKTQRLWEFLESFANPVK